MTILLPYLRTALLFQHTMFHVISRKLDKRYLLSRIGIVPSDIDSALLSGHEVEIIV